MDRKIKYLGGVLLLGLMLSSPALMAADWTDRTNISGFYSSRYSVTDEKTYFHGDRDTGINDEGSFQGTKIGLTVTSQVNEDLTVAMLLMSADGHEKYSTHVDWAFASFRLTDDFTLRTGKIKFPVGLVNEYVDVGATYPWITPPLLLYSEETTGPQATREAYTGASLLWEGEVGDWSLGSDLFFGQVDLEGMTVKGTLGVTVRANWDDTVEFQASTYQGDMKTDPAGPMAVMNEKAHSAKLIGAKLDWNDVVAYAEVAKVEMDVIVGGQHIGDSDTWYVTLGYRLGKFLPHITRQDWERGNGDNHQISTVGVAYSLTDAVVLKAEQSRIDTNNYATQQGLFDSPPSSGSTNMTSIAVDIIF